MGRDPDSASALLRRNIFLSVIFLSLILEQRPLEIPDAHCNVGAARGLRREAHPFPGQKNSPGPLDTITTSVILVVTTTVLI